MAANGFGWLWRTLGGSKNLVRGHFAWDGDGLLLARGYGNEIIWWSATSYVNLTVGVSFFSNRLWWECKTDGAMGTELDVVLAH